MRAPSTRAPASWASRRRSASSTTASGLLKPLGSAERAVFDDVMAPDRRAAPGVQEPLLRHPQVPDESRGRQAERVGLPRRRALSVHLRERPRALVLAAARHTRRAAGLVHRSRTSAASSWRPSGAPRCAPSAACTVSRTMDYWRKPQRSMAADPRDTDRQWDGLRRREAVLIGAWPTRYLSTSPPASTCRKSTTRSTRRARKSRSATTSRARAPPSI